MSSVTPELQLDIERFLYEEAALLDAREFRKWLALFAEDVVYQMPVEENLELRRVGGAQTQRAPTFYFDETLGLLQQRVKRLETGRAWAESPPSRTRHLVTNVYLKPAPVAGEWDVECCFVVHRSRLERQVDSFIGRRVDRLRPGPGNPRWLIARRVLTLDQGTLLANNLSIFF